MRKITKLNFKQISSILLAVTVLVGTVFFRYTYAQSTDDCYPNVTDTCYGRNIQAADTNDQSSLEPITGTIVGLSMMEGARQIMGVGNAETVTQNSIQKSAVGFMINGSAMAYSNPPANLAYWVEDTGKTLGFLPRTYAQGTGFVGLRPLLNVWRVFRNTAYVLLSMAIIVVGFMIMFRRRIDPHTVVTVQNALPRIIIVLITITFSYAIAAFLIELMYIVMFILITLVSSAFGTDIAGLTGVYVTGGAFDLLGRMMSPLSSVNAGWGAILGGVGIGSAIAPGLGSLIGGVLGYVTYIFANAFSSGGSFAGIITPILWLFFAIAIFFVFFRVFFLLISTYIQILLAVITAPLVLLMDVFPGNNAFLNWIVGLIGNLSTFVVVAGVLMITGAIMSNISTAQLWTPPFVGGVDNELLKMIMGVGGIMLIPNVVKLVKEALKVQTPLPMGVGSAMGPVAGTAGAALNLGSQFYYLQNGPVGGFVRKLRNKK